MGQDNFGEATIVYEHPEEGTVEETVANEHLAYFQEHWILKAGEDDEGDVVRRIPRERVHQVERSVEAFEREVATLRDQVESFADELRSTLFGQGDRGETSEEPTRIDVEAGSDDNVDR